MLLWTLALRNLRRNTRRTLITMAGISLGLALMVMSNNLSYGSHQDMLRRAISLLAGHVVVQAQGYQADPDDGRVLVDSSQAAAALRQALPEATIVRRLQVEGLMTSPTSSVGVVLRGVEPQLEATILDIDERLVEGEWLADDDKAVVMGKSMVDSLGLTLGDKVVFMGQPDGDEVQSKLFRLRGIYETGSPELDGFVAVVTLAAAQELYAAQDPATQIAVHLDSDQQTEAALASARAALPGTEREILAWPDAIPDIRDFVALDSAINDGIWMILGVIVAMGVVNTVLMSVLERVREFGVMMSLGLRPGQLAAMVLSEGFALGLISAFIGMILGLAFSYPLVVYGLDFSEEFGQSMEVGSVPVSMVIYAELDWSRLFVYPAVGIGFALFASLYPAWKVMRLSPVQAIRHQ